MPGAAGKEDAGRKRAGVSGGGDMYAAAAAEWLEEQAVETGTFLSAHPVSGESGQIASGGLRRRFQKGREPVPERQRQNGSWI